MNVGKLIIAGAESTLGAVYNTTTNSLTGVFQTPIKNLVVSAAVIYGATLGARTLVRMANNLQAKGPTLINTEEEQAQTPQRTSAKKILLYTAAFFAGAIAVYELGSTLAHFYNTGSDYYAIRDNCRALSDTYSSKYEKMKDFLREDSHYRDCIFEKDLPRVVVQEAITVAREYASAGCDKVLSPFRRITASWIDRRC